MARKTLIWTTLRTYDQVWTMLQQWRMGQTQHLILRGRPGTFKSTMMSQWAAATGFQRIEVGGTYKGFLAALQEHGEDPILCLDDLPDDMFQHKHTIFACKRLTERNQPIRRVPHWTNDGESEILVRSRICFIVNDFESSVPVGFNAFADRCACMTFEPSNKEVLFKAASLGVGTKLSNRFMAEQLIQNPELEHSLSARALEIAAENYGAKNPDWQNFARQSLGLPENIAWSETMIDLNELDKAFMRKKPQIPDAIRYDIPDEDEEELLDKPHLKISEGTNIEKSQKTKREINKEQTKITNLSKIPATWVPIKSRGGIYILEDCQIAGSALLSYADQGLVEMEGGKGKRMVRRTQAGNNLVSNNIKEGS